MKKASLVLVFILLCIASKGFSQTTPPTDFFAGKWEIAISGTPNGEVKFQTNLIRKEGKLTGELADPADAAKPKLPITKVEETSDKLAIYFMSDQAGELVIDLKKVDEDNLKGTVYNFDTVAKRLK